MDPQQQFCLKWNSYSSNLAMTFSNLFKSELLADVTLFCGGTVFKAHKLILAACSKNFAELFESAPTSASCLVILEATSSENMAALLEFMYKGEVHVSQEALNGFLKAAENLQVKGLSTEHGRLAAAQSHSHDDCPMDGCRSPSPSMALHSGPPTQTPTSHNHHHHHHHHHGQSQQPASGGAPHNSRSGCASPGTPQHGGACSLKSADCDAVSMHGASTAFSYGIPDMASISNMASMYQNRALPFDQTASRKRSQRSPAYNEAECSRQSVLRDGSRSSAEDCSPGSKGYRPASNASSNAPIECDAVHTDRLSPASSPSTSAPPNGSVIATLNENNDSNHHSRSPHVKQEASSSRNANSSGAQDLRVKLEAYESTPQASSSSGMNATSLASLMDRSGSDTSLTANLVASIAPADMLNVWNATKMNQKGGTVNTADGKKLKCLYCDRLYGYETNLRAHIRQRHQGIRVPCPFCSRTFTRNNTVRRHIAREHKHELGMTDASANDPESPTPADSGAAPTPTTSTPTPTPPTAMQSS